MRLFSSIPTAVSTLPYRCAQPEELVDGRVVQLKLGATQETLTPYPCWFRLTMAVWFWHAGRLRSLPLRTTGAMTIPFGFGLHPCFNLFSLESVRFEGLPARCLTHLTLEDASPTGQRPGRSRRWPAAAIDD